MTGIIGVPVSIFVTDTRFDRVEPAGDALCGGRWWLLEESSRMALQELIGGCVVGDMICEHMLAMD